MRRCHGLFRPSGAFSRHQFSADYTITMFGFDFRHGQVPVLDFRNQFLNALNPSEVVDYKVERPETAVGTGMVFLNSQYFSQLAGNSRRQTGSRSRALRCRRTLDRELDTLLSLILKGGAADRINEKIVGATDLTRDDHTNGRRCRGRGTIVYPDQLRVDRATCFPSSHLATMVAEKREASIP